MSQENVDLVRRSIAAYQRGEWEEATAYLAPDAVWEVGQELPARGPAAVREMWTRWNDEWERLDMIGEEIVGAGDKVFVAMHYQGLGRLSGVTVDQWVFEVHTFRDGQCISKVDFETRAQALEAVGLSEQPMSHESVELVVAGLERWNSGDDAGALELFAPDIEFHHNIGLGTPLEGVYHGHSEVRKLWADIRESFGEARFDIERATEHGGVVLVLGTLRLRGSGSGATADTPFGLLAEVEHGLARRQFLWTGDQSKALEAAGLAE